MSLFFLMVGVIVGMVFLGASAEANIGYGIVCGLSFVAAAIVRLAQAVERLSEARQPAPKNRHAWSMPDAPAEEGGAGGA